MAESGDGAVELELVIDVRWMKALHQHYRRLRTFSAADVQRVLGDPRESVQIRLGNGSPQISRIS